MCSFTVAFFSHEKALLQPKDEMDGPDTNVNGVHREVIHCRLASCGKDQK
jgi:hypothetical protein